MRELKFHKLKNGERIALLGSTEFGVVTKEKNESAFTLVIEVRTVITEPTTETEGFFEQTLYHFKIFIIKEEKEIYIEDSFLNVVNIEKLTTEEKYKGIIKEILQDAAFIKMLKEGYFLREIDIEAAAWLVDFIENGCEFQIKDRISKLFN